MRKMRTLIAASCSFASAQGAGCGVMLSDAPVSAIERELDRAIGRGIAAFMETLDRTSIAGLVKKTNTASAA